MERDPKCLDFELSSAEAGGAFSQNSMALLPKAAIELPLLSEEKNSADTLQCSEDRRRQREYLAFMEAILHDPTEYRKLLALREGRAEALLDLLQSLLIQLNGCPDLTPSLKSSVIQAMVRLSRSSGMFPPCLAIRNVRRFEDHPVAVGAFGDVWRGGWRLEPWNRNSNDVCLKIVRLCHPDEIRKALQIFMREAIIWQQLRHPNLLPFLGIYYLNGNRRRVCLISPWMENGDLSRFLRNTPRSEVHHIGLVWDIANGLSYLHKMEIIHADLKGANILMSDSKRAVIADFGLSRVGDGAVLEMASKTTKMPDGTTRWTAPEILLEQHKPTPASDMYSFACVCYEIYTSQLPFHDLRYDSAIIVQLLDGNRPPRPSQSDFPELNDHVWDFISECWSCEPSSRPLANDIRIRCEALSPSTAPIAPPSDWDPRIYQPIKYSVKYNTEVYNDPELYSFLSACYERIVARIPDHPYSGADFHQSPSLNFPRCNTESEEECLSRSQEEQTDISACIESVSNAFEELSVEEKQHGHGHDYPGDNHAISCNGCEQLISGARYQCASCPSSPTAYNLCAACEKASYIFHDPFHIFFKLKRPVDTPIESESPFVPSLYKTPAGPDHGVADSDDFSGNYLQTLVHSYAFCDRHMEKIVGVWYRCAHCDKDYCGRCEAEPDEHNDTHVFLVLKSQINRRMLGFLTKSDNPAASLPAILSHAVYRPRDKAGSAY